MSKFFKSKGKFGLSLGAVFLVILLAVGSFAYLNKIVPAEPEAEPAETEQVDGIPESEPEPEPEPEPPEPEPEPEPFNLPAEMRGAMLRPGADFLKGSDTSEAAIRSEVDAAFANARKLEINSVIVDTSYEDRVIYQTKDAPELSSGFDLLAYILGKAEEEDFYTYAIFDASLYDSRSRSSMLMAVGSGAAASRLAANLQEFAEKYDLDGILLDGYAYAPEKTSYSTYLSLGGGIGFDNFMRQSPSAVVKTASGAIRKASPGTQVGLLADAVWENRSVNEEGSATEASYTALSHGNADTKGFIEKGYVDFVAVKAYTTTDSKSEPFEEVVNWWAEVARRHDVPLYVVHATDKLFTAEAGWGSADQLIRQIDAVEGVSGVRGSIFNNLEKVSSNTQNVTDNIIKLYAGEVEAEQILTQLEMTKPAQTTYTTSDPQVTFTGASDPGEPVHINGEEITTDATGYFTVQYQLKVGLNPFVIEHKDKKIEYSITRKVEVLKEAGPMNNIATEGGMAVTITAVAYQDATVYATINGTTVSMQVDDSVESEADRDGYFRHFTGRYTVPAATGEVQNLGGIVVYAEYEGEKASIQAGSVQVNKKARLEDGVAVRVVADQAITYPPDTLDNVPDARYYPLPAGAMDYAVGDEITYQKEDKLYKYYVLASGLRVESKDIAAIADDFPSGNVITGLSVKSEDGFTYVTLKTVQQVSYSVTYAASGISFRFHNTTGVPDGMALSKNPLFTAADWSGQTLTLSFAKQNGFMGYKGYYDSGGNLVLRFNNPPSSLSGARIAIDPGHGGGDKGASGFLADYPESVVNSLIAQALAEELQSRGATVNLMSNAGIEGEQRKQAAEQWNADLFVSIHSNSAPNINATGTEVFYFHPFSQTLAANAAGGVSGALNTNNRGAKQSYYHVTLSSQMPSALVECGFLTNKDEYEKLIKSKYHRQIAAGIADALSSTIKAHGTDVSASGSESTGNAADTTDSGNAADGASSGGQAEAVMLPPEVGVDVGQTVTLTPEFNPEDAADELTWKSSDDSVARVDQNGNVTGVKEGTATITVTARASGAQDTCTVTVGSSGSDSGEPLSKADSVWQSEYYHELAPGAGVRLEIYSNLSQLVRGGDFKWSSSDSSVAAVDGAGNVTAKKRGSALITASAEGFDPLEWQIDVV